jgi:hypothetical protein
MGVSYADTVNKYLTKWKSDIYSNYISKNRKASGKFGESLAVEMDGVGGAITSATGYGKFIEFGRGATHGSAGLVPLHKLIYKWIDDKGLGYKDEKEHVSMSFAISKHIHKHGVKIGADRQIVTPVITEQNINELQNELGNQVIANVVNELKASWQSGQQ